MTDRRLIDEARRNSAALAWNAIAALAQGLLMIAQAALFSRIIQQAFQLGFSLAQTLPLTGWLAGVIGLRAGFTFLATVSAAGLAIGAKSRLRLGFIARLQTLGPAFLQEERSGDLTVSATEGVEKLDGYFRDYLPALLLVMLLPPLILLVVLPVDGLTFAVFLITAPLIPFFMWLIGMAAGVVAEKQFAKMRQLGAHFLDIMQGLTTLKAFNRSQAQTGEIEQVTNDFRRATMDVLRVAFLSSLTLEMLATLSVAIVAVEIGVRLINGGIAFEQALFLLIIAPEFYQPLRTLGAKFHNATESKVAARRIFAVMDAPIPMPPAPAPADLPVRLDLCFQNVSLTYPTRDAPALDGICCEIGSGTSVALVGVSGSGKSSIANLLLRFVEPSGGRILVSGVDLAVISPQLWRTRLAWVGQAPYLFAGSVLENIRFAMPDAGPEEIFAAARQADADGFIRDLPLGYATLCGEKGLRLSGGQAQRIALARAFLRDAPILILDEPTANLDPASEAEIMTALRRLAAGRTVISISHRMATVRDADQILVLQGGRLVEQGRHEALLERRGVYAQFVAHESEGQ